MTTLRTLTLTLTAAATFYVLPNVALACPHGVVNCDEQPEPATELAGTEAGNGDQTIEPFPGGLRLACASGNSGCRATTPEPVIELACASGDSSCRATTTEPVIELACASDNSRCRATTPKPVIELACIVDVDCNDQPEPPIDLA